MKCEHCDKEHDGNYASGRFCSYKCSRGFSTKVKRKEINAKVSFSLKKLDSDLEEYIQSYIPYKPKKEFKKARSEDLYVIDGKYTTKYVSERILKDKRKENKCEICGITEWLNRPIVIQLHHINGNRKDNRLENLQMLCPNCHTQTDNWGKKKIKSPRSLTG